MEQNKERLLELKYKLWSDFKKKDLAGIIEQVMEREMNLGIFGDFYFKFQQQFFEYEGGIKNSIALCCCVVLDKDAVVDAFCVPAYPFMLKSRIEVECLNSLIETFLDELDLADTNETVGVA